MIKLNILNMKAFLAVANACRDAVYLISSDGQKADICRRYDLQNRLLDDFQENGNFLSISLSVANPSDYMAIVSYYAGDC